MSHKRQHASTNGDVAFVCPTTDAPVQPHEPVRQWQLQQYIEALDEMDDGVYNRFLLIQLALDNPTIADTIRRTYHNKAHVEKAKVISFDYHSSCVTRCNVMSPQPSAFLRFPPVPILRHLPHISPLHCNGSNPQAPTRRHKRRRRSSANSAASTTTTTTTTQLGTLYPDIERRRIWRPNIQVLLSVREKHPSIAALIVLHYTQHIQRSQRKVIDIDQYSKDVLSNIDRQHASTSSSKQHNTSLDVFKDISGSIRSIVEKSESSTRPLKRWRLGWER